jgi:hypothetical protein
MTVMIIWQTMMKKGKLKSKLETTALFRKFIEMEQQP